jgi:myosin heavy subunit
LNVLCHALQTESETFDLAGQNVSTITTTIHSAFAEPFPLQEMIRITFVTGAGKLGRQKYDEGAAKAVTSTLRELGFEEDRGASCVVECGGSFKLQHDTGKNLKTVVVFPKITSEGDQLEGDVADLSINQTKQSLLPIDSPEQVIAMSSQTLFERMLQSKCPSWAQKKGCVAAIESTKKIIEELETKLLSGTPLTAGEQDMYDSVSMSSLDEKETHVKAQMHSQVESGKLTKLELETLLHQVSEKIDSLDKEIAQSQDKPKKLEKLKATKEKVTERKAVLEKIEPTPPHRLRNEAEIQKLRVDLQPLLKLEDGAKGRLLSVKETQTLARKDEILEEIAQLEVRRTYFTKDT